MPECPPSISDFNKIIEQKHIDITKLLSIQLDDSRYFSYDDTKYRTVPKSIESIGGDRSVWWLSIMLGRSSRFQNLPILSADNIPFKFFIDNSDLQVLHEIDLNGGGTLGVGDIIPSEGDRNKYFINSLIEESFSSSFIEGAVSTRELAKKMIAENRDPKNKSEKMILNNFITMQKLGEWKDEPLSPELICRIHSYIANGTLDDSKLGKFRTENDKDIVVGDDEGNVYHTPCPFERIPDKLKELCAFANTQTNGIGFIHPIVKAIMLHFMLAYIHPFCDGNGRTSRTLFYWYLLKNNYWIVKFTSISKIIAESGNRYYMSFLNTERDGYDLNYFIKFQLEVFSRAIKAFYAYIDRKKRELTDYSKHYEVLKKLNDREARICLRLINKPFENLEITIESHATLNGVSWETSRKDLKHLLKEKILERKKSGKVYVFIPTREFLDQIKS